MPALASCRVMQPIAWPHLVLKTFSASWYELEVVTMKKTYSGVTMRPMSLSGGHPAGS